MNELQLVIIEEMVVLGSQEEKILLNTLKGGRELEVFGVQYAVTHVESETTGTRGFLVNRQREHKITASRLVPIIMPDGEKRKVKL